MFFFLGNKIKKIFFSSINKFSGRRTRAAKSAIMTISVKSDGTKIDGMDQNFSSPKRKDCKLDTDSIPSTTTTAATKNERATKSSPLHNVVITNGKRNHKNAGGAKTKKVPQAITKYFHTNGHNESNGSSDNSINESNGSDLNGETLPNGDSNVKMNDSIVDEKTTVPIQNGSILMSPEAKALQNGGKQTTPHRIVIRSSPTKKQRLYVKDPVEVFSNLNIRDGASKIGRKGQQKTRRKLNVTEPEQQENGKSVHVKSVDEVQSVVNDSENAIENTIVKKSNSISIVSENISKTNGESFPVPINVAPRRVQNTQLTDFFPIRRSGRKTKKAVEQEISRHIEMAIEKQLEDGLVVKVFAEKGRGIVAGRPFQRGEFVVEYIGELIDQTEADRREEEYSQKSDFGCYMYYFKNKEQQWW